MKPIKCNIKKLGAVSDSEIEIKPLMVFSGESGLGKSYVAFLVHYLFVLLKGNRLYSYFKDREIDIVSTFKNRKAGETMLIIDTKDLFDWINKDAVTYIGYLLGNDNLSGDVSIEFPFYVDTLQFKYDEELSGLDGQESLYYKITLEGFTYSALSTTKDTKPISPFTDLIKAVLVDAIFGNFRSIAMTLLLPPSSGALLLLTERPSFRSGMYEEFFDMKNAINRPLTKQEAISDTIRKCLDDINLGSLKQNDGGQIMYYTNGIEIPLTAAASSIKELAPLTLLLSKFSTKGMSLLLEEPEAHIHPGRQIMIADLITFMVNAGGLIQITTHSDYLIKRINVLIKLYQLRSRIQKEEFDEVLQKYHICEECLINPDIIGAYILKRNADGTSNICKQNIEEDDEIPFESFYDVINDDIDISTEIRNLQRSSDEEL